MVSLKSGKPSIDRSKIACDELRVLRQPFGKQPLLSLDRGATPLVGAAETNV